MPSSPEGSTLPVTGAPVPLLAAATAPVPDLAPTSVVRSPERRRRRVLVGSGMVLLGLVLAGVGATTPLLVTPAKVLLVLGGIASAVAGAGRVASALRGNRVDVVFGLAMAWLVVLGLAVVLAPVLPLGNHNDAAAALTEPFYARPSLGSEHPLGTNNYGLDVLARAVYGGRTSLVIAGLAVLIGSVVGCAIGIVAGFFRGAVDSAVGILANSLLAVPPLILLIALGTVLDPGVRNLAFALALLTVPGMVRVARANTIAFAQRDFVLAARALGATRWRIMARELLPNVLPPMLSLAVVMTSMLIVAEASLSFLGLGIQAPEPTWGNMISEGEGGVMEEHPHIVVIPGLCLFFTVFAVNLLGERLQKRWDPRSAKL
jgi:peptide/nickel transport system permease protein